MLEHVASPRLLVTALAATGIAVALLLTPETGTAQQASSRFADGMEPHYSASGATTHQQTKETTTGEMVGSGLVGGMIGFLGGGALGALIASDCTGGDFCQLGGAFIGAAAGGTLGMATGVHRANRGRGSFVTDVLVGGAIWAAGIALASQTHSQLLLTSILIAIPATQLASIVAIEKGSSRRQASEH